MIFGPRFYTGWHLTGKLTREPHISGDQPPRERGRVDLELVIALQQAGQKQMLGATNSATS